MLEAVLTISVFTTLFAGMVLLHQLALADIQASQEARFQAYHEAMTGCQDQAFDLRSLVTDLAHGNLPMADSFLPSKSAEGKASISVSDVMGLSGGTVSRVARIPCRALPIKAPPSPGDWLFDLFK